MSFIQFRRASKLRWAQLNHVLRDGEPGYEEDTKRWKVGDGVTPWNELDYVGSDPNAAVTLQDLEDHINSLEPHPAYDDGPSLELIYENAKV